MLSAVIKLELSLSDLLVRCVADGQAAMRSITERPPDVLILDVSLPGLNGFEIVQSLRSTQDLRLLKIPVIVYTSNDLTEPEREKLKLGETVFITKTMETDELSRQVLRLIS